MRVYGLWHGGADYAMPYVDNENLEVFPSLGAAKAALRERQDTGGWQRQEFTFADGRTASVLCPNVGPTSSITVWFYDPLECEDPYPDRVIEFGPRGGVRVSFT